MKNITNDRLINTVFAVLISLILLVASVLPLVVQNNVAYADMVGWTYRKQLPITGVVGGSGNYSMFITAYADNYYFSADGSGLTSLAAGLNNPTAYYYNGYTYVVFQGRPSSGDGDPYITRYKHSTGVWDKPVRIGVNLAVLGDSHCQPAVIIRTDVGHVGKILVVWGGHNYGEIQWAESTNAEDISSWNTAAGVGTTGSFPSIVQASSGDIYLTYRSSAYVGGTDARVWVYRKMLAGASSWGVEVPFIDWRDSGVIGDEPHRAMMAYDSVNDKIWWSMSYYDSALVKEVNQWVLAYRPTDNKIYDTAGNSFAVAVNSTVLNDPAYSFRIFNDTTANTIAGGISLDTNHYPYVVFTSQDAATLYHDKYTSWNGTAWTALTDITTFTAASSPLNNISFYMNAVVATAANNVDAYMSVANGDLERWHYNGSSWAKTATVLAMSTEPAVSGSMLAVPQVPFNHASGLDVVFCSADLIASNSEKRLYAYNSSSGLVEFKAPGFVTLNGHAKSDFSDVRFVADDNTTVLGYSLLAPEGGAFPVKTNSNQANYILKVSSDLSSNQNIYCYYGNAGASYTGNISQAALFGDDFESNNFGAWSSAGSKWTVNSTVYKNGSYSAYGVGGDVPPNSSLREDLTMNSASLYAIHYWIRPTTNLSYPYYQVGQQGVTEHYPISADGNATGNQHLQYYNGAAWLDFSPVLTYGANRWDEIIEYIDLPNHKYKIQYTVASSNVTTTAYVTNVFTTADIVNVQLVAYNLVGRNIYIDDVYVRKWLTTEPSWGVNGSEVNLTLVIPTVTTQNATSVQLTSALGNGTITSTGGENCDIVGFQWGTITGIYTHNVTSAGSFGAGAFNASLTGMSSNTPIFYIAQAHNSVGWGYGSEVSFTTLSPSIISASSPAGNFISAVAPLVYVAFVVLAVAMLPFSSENVLFSVVLRAVIIYIGVAFLSGIVGFINNIVG